MREADFFLDIFVMVKRPGFLFFDGEVKSFLFSSFLFYDSRLSITRIHSTNPKQTFTKP